MASDYERFLTPVSAERPSGEDLDETGELFAIDQAVGWVLDGNKPAWMDIQDAAEAALGRTRDGRLAVTLAVALLHTEGLPGFARGIHLLRGLFEGFWDTLHPRLDEDGSADARRFALANLNNFHKLRNPLRRLPLVDQKGVGRFSSLDVDIVEGKAEAPADYKGELPQAATVSAAFAAAGPVVLRETAGHLAAIAADLQALGKIFEDRAADGGGAPDLEPLLALVRRGEAIVRARLPQEATADDPSAKGGAASESGSPSGSPRSRRDALLAIEKAANYFRQYEPSSPLPLLLERAMKLADADFLTIVQDIAPDALVQVKMLRGGSQEE